MFQFPKKRFRFQVKNGDIDTYLTRTEALIIFLFIQGLKPKQVSDKLNISFNTVNSHIASIRIKLQCKTMFQLGHIMSKYENKLTEIFSVKIVNNTKIYN